MKESLCSKTIVIAVIEMIGDRLTDSFRLNNSIMRMTGCTIENSRSISMGIIFNLKKKFHLLPYIINCTLIVNDYVDYGIIFYNLIISHLNKAFIIRTYLTIALGRLSARYTIANTLNMNLKCVLIISLVLSFLFCTWPQVTYFI